MMLRALLLSLVALPAAAETLVATRTIPSRTVLAPSDVALVAGVVPGALADPASAVGREARVALYAGRPIRGADLTAPALVERNAPVTLVYRHGTLVITAEGRALDRAAAGEVLRAMNLASRGTVSGIVRADGTVMVMR